MIVSDLETNMSLGEYEYWLAYLMYKNEEQDKAMKKAKNESGQHSRVNMPRSRS